MAKLLKLRRGTTSQHGSFTGAEGEVTIDTTKDTAVVHDGSTAGGRALAREDLNNVSSSTIAGRLSNDSITPSKIGSGTLPSDVTVASANIVNGTIVGADISNNTITAVQLANGAADVNVVLDGAIVNSKLGANAVTNAKIADLTIATAKLADNAVTNAKIADVTIATAKLADNAVTNAKINDVNGSKIAAGTVSTAKLADDAVTYAKIQNVSATDRILGRDSSGAGVIEEITPANLRTMINVENGATADQSNAEIRAAVEAASDSNVFTDADHSKLNGIEASATADQTAAEIRTLVESASDSNVFTDADHTKLNGIEASATADQTASEIVSLLNGQSLTPNVVTANNVYAPTKLGRDSTDYIVWTDNTRLDVYIAGSNEFRFQANGEFHADGDITAFSSTISSDKKLKENIQVVPNALDKVQALNGVTFDWKRDGTPSAGVIAQEVQAILPEAVKEVTSLKGGDSHLAVNYHALTSILIESIKELKAEIDELKGGK